MANGKDSSIGYGHPALCNFYQPGTLRVVADTVGPSLTRQEFQDECDVNVLMARYERTGVWPMPADGSDPQYLDVSEVPDLMTAQKVLADAHAAFMTLPAQVRREFDNNAVAFVEFATDPANADQMRDWGLFPPLPPKDPTEGLVAGSPGAAPAPGGVSAAGAAPAVPRAP